MRLDRCARSTAVKLTATRMRRQRIDLGRDAEPHHGVDDDGQGRRGGAVGEEGDHELVERQREREQGTGDDAGASVGTVMRKKVPTAVRPRSREASSRDGSTCPSRAFTTAATKAVEKTTWARSTECKPERHRDHRVERQQADRQHDVRHDRRRQGRAPPACATGCDAPGRWRAACRAAVASTVEPDRDDQGVDDALRARSRCRRARRTTGG